MAVKDVAHGLVDLCKQGQFHEAIERYYSDDIVSVEPEGESPTSHGIEAVKAKGQWWYENFEVHSAGVFGPYINGDQFGVRFIIDTTHKASGKRSTMEEIGVYTVKDDKVVYERFFNLDE